MLFKSRALIAFLLAICLLVQSAQSFTAPSQLEENCWTVALIITVCWIFGSHCVKSMRGYPPYDPDTIARVSRTGDDIEGYKLSSVLTNSLPGCLLATVGFAVLYSSRVLFFSDFDNHVPVAN